jgi:hypothetical protein
MKKYLIYLLTIFSFLGIVGFVWAYDLTLTKIGTLSTIGADYTLVSYVGAVPSLEGTATPAATVSVKVNSTTANTIAATTSGIWTFTPTSLNAGDNLITITSGTQSIIFTIRYSATVTPTASSSAVTTTTTTATSLPETGTWENILFGVIAGVLVWFLGRYVKKEMHVWEKGK